MKSWSVGSPAGDAVRHACRQRTGALSAGRRPAARVVLSDRPGLQGHARRSACGVNFSDPLQFNRASVVASLLARRRPAGGGTRCTAGRLRALRLARRAPRCNSGRLLRSVRSDQDRPQGLRRRRRPHEHADLRRAAPPRARHRAARSPATSIGCRSTRTCRSTSIGCYDASTATLTVQRHPQLARPRRRRERARSWSVGRPEATSSTARLVPQRFTARYDRGVALPVGHSSIWLRTAAGFSPRDRARAVRQLLLRRLRQQLRRSRRREALSRVLQLPGRRAERDRRPQFREVHDRVEPAAVAVPPRSARRVST